jgi:hypothetical protein
LEKGLRISPERRNDHALTCKPLNDAAAFEQPAAAAGKTFWEFFAGVGLVGEGQRPQIVPPANGGNRRGGEARRSSDPARPTTESLPNRVGELW